MINSFLLYLSLVVYSQSLIYDSFRYDSLRSHLGSNTYNESETLTKHEIMDGTPLKSEVIPIRLFLSGFDVTPTYKDVSKRFSCRYYLNLILVDEEGRRYFKQQEILIYRRDDQ